MSWHGDIALGDTIDIQFCTVQATGAPTTLAGSPVISAYIGNSLTQLTAGITLTVDFDGVTGLNNVRVVATGGNGYATATNVSLIITTGTVNSVSVVGYQIGSFSIENRQSNVKFWNGTAVATPATAGIPDVNVKNIDNDAASASGTVTFPNATLASTTNITAGVITTVTTVTNQLTAAAIATGVWQDATAGDFTTASSIGKSLYTGNVAPGGTNGLLIAGSNAATTFAGLTTGALAATTITASGAVAFQSTFAVTTSTALAALSCTTLTASGAVAFQSTFAVTTSTALAALSATTVTASGAVALQSTLAVTGTTTLTGAVTAANASNNIVGIDVAKLSGDATAADNAESFFDGTGYAGTNNVIPLVTVTTTATNLTNAATAGDLTATMKTSVTTAATAATPIAASVTGAVGSVAGNVGGNVVGTLGNLAAGAKADVNAEVLDVLNVDTYAPPTAVPNTTASLATKITWLFTVVGRLHKRTMNKTTGVEVLRNAADAGNVATATNTDDGTTTTLVPLT